MFGRTKTDETDAASPALMSEVARLDALLPPELAAEVMGKAFGPGGPAAAQDATVTVGGPNVDAGVTASAIAIEFVTLGHQPEGDEIAAHVRLEQLVAEGFQALEHAALVRVQMHTSMGELDYAITRKGRAALTQSAVERVVAGP